MHKIITTVFLLAILVIQSCSASEVEAESPPVGSVSTVLSHEALARIAKEHAEKEAAEVLARLQAVANSESIKGGSAAAQRQLKRFYPSAETSGTVRRY